MYQEQPKSNWWVWLLIIIGIMIVGILVWYIISMQTSTETETSSTKEQKTEAPAGEMESLRVGWKEITGCVQPYNSEDQFTFKFYGKDEWVPVLSDMGCGSSMPTDGSWGLKNVEKENGEKVDVALVLATLSPQKDPNSDAQVVPITDIDTPYYLALSRVKTYELDAGATKTGIEDADWEYIKSSFTITN